MAMVVTMLMPTASYLGNVGFSLSFSRVVSLKPWSERGETTFHGIVEMKKDDVYAIFTLTPWLLR